MRTRPWGLISRAALLLALVAERPAHAETGNWFALHTWSARHGLPESAVRGLLQDRDGYLWVATVAGLARFDGVRFIVFDDREHGPLKEIELQAMAQAADGSIWIASFGGGITRLHQGKFTTFTTAQGLGGNFATSLLADRDGAIWAGTDEGLSRWKDGQIRTFTTRDGLPENQTHPLYSDVDGTLLLTRRSGGLLRHAGGKFSPASLPGLQGETTVRALLRDRSGALWIATHIGLFQQKDGQTRQYTTADGLATNRVAALAEDSEGNLWIGTDGGLTRHRDGAFETHAVADFNGRGVTALTASREGGVFVGSGTVTYVRRRQFRHYGQEDGLPHYMATTFFQDSQGTLWIGTIRGLASLRDGKVTSHSPDPIPGRIVGGIIEDRAGHLWVGSDTGLYRSRAPLAQGPPALVRVPDQPARTIETRVMFLDRDGALWIGAVLEGLVRYRDGAFTVFTTKDGLLHNAVRGIQQDRSGTLWMGTRGGLNRLQDGKFTGFTTADGLAHDTVESLFLDSEGTLWVGTRRGVTRYKDGRFSTLTVDHGLLASYVNSFAEDDHKQLWMVSIRGVFRASLERLNAVADGKASSLAGTPFGVEHGLPSPRAAAGYDRTVYRTSDGRIWAGMVRGASFIEPAARLMAAAPPPVRIEEVQADGRTLPNLGGVIAPPGRGDLNVQYTGLSFVAPEKVRFRYRLDGYDRDWVDAEHRRMAFYSNLPPGNYQFRVQAATADGGWNAVPAAVSVVLRPRWTQSWLFRIAAMLAAVLMGAGLYTNHVRQLKRRQRQLEQAVAERTAELAAVNKELESFSYSVSHDLRAPLRSIEGFGRALLESHAGSLNAEGQQFLGHMRRASERMERLIDDMLRLARVARTDMARQRVDLSALAADITATLARQQPQRQVEVVVPPGLVADADPNLIRIALENLIGNAWKFTGKRPAARIELGQHASNGTPAFFVRDNGAGFDPAYAGKLFNAFQRLHAASEFEGNGVGLTTVRRIIQRHGGRVWAEAALDAGATFYFTVPDEPGDRTR